MALTVRASTGGKTRRDECDLSLFHLFHSNSTLTGQLLQENKKLTDKLLKIDTYLVGADSSHCRNSSDEGKVSPAAVTEWVGQICATHDENKRTETKYAATPFIETYLSHWRRSSGIDTTEFDKRTWCIGRCCL